MFFESFDFNCFWRTHLESIKIAVFIGESENRNKGYGVEALNLLIRYGFDYLNLNNIMLSVYSFNENAINCYKKVGFKEFGRRRGAVMIKNERFDNS